VPGNFRHLCARLLSLYRVESDSGWHGECPIWVPLVQLCCQRRG